VETVLVKDYQSNIPDHVADLIYAMDMFHMVKHPDLFLSELHRILKTDGRLIIEDGHQPRENTKNKIHQTHLWKIIKQEKDIWCVNQLDVLKDARSNRYFMTWIYVERSLRGLSVCPLISWERFYRTSFR